MHKKLLLLSLSILFIMVSVALKPIKKYETKPDSLGLKYLEQNITTKDGVVLKAWYFTPKKKSGTCIVMSHDGDGNMVKMLEKASYFLSAGYNVMTYDYRGYGESSPFEIQSNMIVYPQFAKDLDAVIDFAHKKYGITRVFLYGHGIGASLSIAAAARRRDVQKAIAESPYVDLNAYQKRMMEVAGQDVKIPLAYNKMDLDPLYALEGKMAKISKYLLINGNEDPLHTSKDMKSLAKINKGNVEIYTVKKANYVNCFSKDKVAYFERIKAFIQ